MPVYEYQCSDCEAVYESLQPMDTKIAPCPKCAEYALLSWGDRILSATPTTFKHADKKAIKDNRS